MCKNKTKLCRRLFVATLFIIVRNWKQPNSQKENPPLNKLQYIYIMGYYTAVSLKKLLVHVARWMNLKKHNDDQKKPDIKEVIYTDLY